MNDFFKNFKGIIQKDFSLKQFNSFKIDAKSKLAIFPKSEEDLIALFQIYNQNPFNYFILGEGSNILLNDKIIHESFISLNKMPKKLEKMNSRLGVSAGVTIRELLKMARENGFQGFEKLCGIPGNVGGSIFMNAGTHLGEISDLLDSFKIFNLKTGEFKSVFKKDFKFHYRKNLAISPHDLIIAATFNIKIGNLKKVQDEIYTSLKRRKESQPLDKPTCGSVFKNPPHYKAWKLIEDVELKGYKIGGAEYSLKHSNWIVNTGSANSKDILDLIELAIKRVQDKFNITLEAEVKKIGF